MRKEKGKGRIYKNIVTGKACGLGCGCSFIKSRKGKWRNLNKLKTRKLGEKVYLSK